MGVRPAPIGYNCTMRFRLGYVLGFGSGYYLGARAGRARYDQLNQLLAKARRSDVYEVATDKAKDLVDDGVERARDFVEEHRSTPPDVDGIPIATIVGSEADPLVADPDDLSPGPPPAGSLSEDPSPGGPVAP